MENNNNETYFDFRCRQIKQQYELKKEKEVKIMINLTKKSFIGYVKQELKLNVVTEHKFHPKRKWRFDYAILDHKIAIEVEGGVWTKGRHVRGKGFINDMEKYNTATALGWKIFRLTPENLLKQNTLDLISQAIKNYNW